MTENPKLPSPEIDVLVVGAGFSGVYSLYALRNAGFSVKVFEAGSGLGGTWHCNRYPGARTDSASSIYQFSIEELWKDWTWSERFPAQGEVVQYFEFADRKLDLSKDVLFNTRMTGARFDTELDRWIVSTENGVVARPCFLILCTGYASKPYIPPYKGLETFKGVMHHTYNWPKDGVDMTGLRIGVIGTGASGIQVVQETGPICAHLTVFQRTPNMALPMMQQKLDISTYAKSKETYPDLFKYRITTFAGFEFDISYNKSFDIPEEKRIEVLEGLWQRGGMAYWLGGSIDLFTSEEANAERYKFWRAKVIPRLKDPSLHEKLVPEIPPHPFGVKRPSLEQNFYDVFNQSNVSLVDLNETPITEVTEAGVKTSDGKEHALDVLVIATGFDAVTGSISQINVEGTDGVLIGDKWKKKLFTYLGLASANYPNMFFIYGPQGPTAFCNGPTCAEVQSDWVISCLKAMRDQGKTRVEATLDAEKEWTEKVNALSDAGLWTRAKSWYTGANIPGKNIEALNFVGGLPLYLKFTDECEAHGYNGFVFS